MERRLFIDIENEAKSRLPQRSENLPSIFNTKISDGVGGIVNVSITTLRNSNGEIIGQTIKSDY